MAEGYIKLYRKMQEWGWYKDACTTRVFLHLLFIACYEDKHYRGETLNAGDVVATEAQIAESLGISRQNVRTAIFHLISTGELTKRAKAKYSVFTIKNYSEYQGANHTANQQLTNNQPTANHPYNTKKLRSEEIKEEKNNIPIGILQEKHGEFANVVLSAEEMQKLNDALGDLGTKDYIERLSAYLAQTGHRYKSHYATLLNWWRKDGKPVKRSVVHTAAPVRELHEGMTAAEIFGGET